MESGTWASILVIVIVLLGTIVSLVILFNWDDPDQPREPPKEPRGKDKKGIFDEGVSRDRDMHGD
jgi:hypothetical protein